MEGVQPRVGRIHSFRGRPPSLGSSTASVLSTIADSFQGQIPRPKWPHPTDQLPAHPAEALTRSPISAAEDRSRRAPSSPVVRTVPPAGLDFVLQPVECWELTATQRQSVGSTLHRKAEAEE